MDLLYTLSRALLPCLRSRSVSPGLQPFDVSGQPIQIGEEGETVDTIAVQGLLEHGADLVGDDDFFHLIRFKRLVGFWMDRKESTLIGNPGRNVARNEFAHLPVAERICIFFYI